jgi:proteasome lid subunit RPN8/RPN11
MLKLTKEHYETIVDHALAGLPYEACGLLSGVGSAADAEASGVVAKVYPLSNIDKSAEHFSMDPKEQFRVIADIRNCGTALIGNFHSHPATPARPSAEDIRLAYDPNLRYLILSLQDGQPLLKSFLIKDGVSTEEPIRLI